VTLLNRDDIERAAERLQGFAFLTPLIHSLDLSQMTGAEIYLKLENLQLTGSFKVRGAYNRLAALSKRERQRGVVTASAGNHAQGVALAACCSKLD